MQISLWLCSIARNNEFLFLASSNTIVTSGFPAARAISRGFFFFYYTWHTRDGQNAPRRRHRAAMYRFARRSNLTFITNIARVPSNSPFVRARLPRFLFLSSPSLEDLHNRAANGISSPISHGWKLGSVVPLFVASIKPILGTIYRYAHICP